jgi:integrase
MRLPNVHRVGQYRYHRLTRAALPGGMDEADPRFIAAWAAEEAKAAKPSAPEAGTVAAACRGAMLSPTVAGLSADYRRSLRNHVAAIEASYGNVMMRALRPDHIALDLERLPGSLGRARRKAWRHVCGFAKLNGWVKSDPSLMTKARPLPRSEGHVGWSVDEVGAYRARWPAGTTQRAGLEVLYWFAARTADAVRLGNDMLGGDGVLTFIQTKTGGQACVPWTCPLPDWAADWHAEREDVRRAIMGAPTFLALADGTPRSRKGLSNVIAAAARETGLSGRSAHGLRKARLMRIAEAGGPTGAIMLWGGHQSMDEAEAYTRAADRRSLLIGRERTRNDVNQPREGVK